MFDPSEAKCADNREAEHRACQQKRDARPGLGGTAHFRQAQRHDQNGPHQARDRKTNGAHDGTLPSRRPPLASSNGIPPNTATLPMPIDLATCALIRPIIQ